MIGSEGQTEEWCLRCDMAPVQVVNADGVGVCANCASVIIFINQDNRGIRHEAEKAQRRKRMSQKNRKGKR